MIVRTAVTLASVFLLVGCNAAYSKIQDNNSNAPQTPEFSVPAGVVEEGYEEGVRNANHGALEPGINYLSFDGWAGKTFPAFIFIPKKADLEKAPIMIMMHGAKRGAVRYLKQWVPHAERKGVIVIAPQFSAENFRGSRRYNLGHVFTSRKDGRKMRNEDEWTFSAIDPLFDHIVSRLGSKQARYTLYGHSAGSQFVHRFLFYKPNAKVKRYLPANAGWYTMPGKNFTYPYGLKNAQVSNEATKRALSADVVILLGDQDNDPAHSSLRRTPEASAQGAHRFARGVNFFREGKRVAKKYGVPFGWKMAIIKGVAHDNGGIAEKAIEFVE